MIYEMNAEEEPDIFNELKKYLQNTYKLSVVESITLLGKIENFIRKETDEIKKNRKPFEIDFNKMDLDDILDVDFIDEK